MLNKKGRSNWRQLTGFLFLVLPLLVMAEARLNDALDQQRPTDISDGRWQSLKAAVQETKLTASDAASFDAFGYAVSISGDRALVGADGSNDAGSRSGSAYVFDFDGKSWNQSAKLTASDAASDDRFGYAASISGDRALIGAYLDDDLGSNSGSVYVFEFDGKGWNENAKLTASDAAAFDQFGYAVSLLGDRALVGAFFNSDAGDASGSAYVFDFNGMSWSESAKLTASDAASFDEFGRAVSLSVDRALVGSYSDDDAGLHSGSAYVFEFDGVSWSESAKLTASDAAAGDWFGMSVSLSGDRALVGAPEKVTEGIYSGAAYVFDYDGLSWSESTKLTASDAVAMGAFGYVVSLSGDRALVGAFGNDHAGTDSGAAYVFDYDGLSWSESFKLTASDAALDDHFGSLVSLSGDRALVGARGKDDAGINSGSAYVFKICTDLIFKHGFEVQNNIVSKEQ